MFIKDQIYDTVKRFSMACGDNSVKITSLKEKIQNMSRKHGP